VVVAVDAVTVTRFSISMEARVTRASPFQGGHSSLIGEASSAGKITSVPPPSNGIDSSAGRCGQK
ncbi:MAG TPA: hypothetical protein VLT36_09600, partial [Candidatus Dormibacteraeota bacterium]|nr:hypothetical protein [Candidatus Dormibacteraeota bacterium]